MDWNDLRAFLAVAEVGSLGGAARALRVSQATVGRRIQGLEQALGQVLFERLPRGYVLNAIGTQLFRRLGSLNRTVEAACARLDGHDRAVEGEVRVVVPDFVSAMLLPALSGLSRRYPHLTVALITKCQAGLSVRDADIALEAAPLATPGFVLDARFRAPFGLYASDGYLRERGRPPAIDACDGHRLICLDHSLAHLNPDAWAASGGKGGYVIMRSNDAMARRAACGAGLGLAVLPVRFAGESPELVQVFGPEAVGDLELLLYVSAEFRREPRVPAVRDMLCDLFTPRSTAAPTLAFSGGGGQRLAHSRDQRRI